jgi:hypothetical protein
MPDGPIQEQWAALASRCANTSDLPGLVDGASAADDLDVGLVDLPTVINGRSAGPGGLGQRGVNRAQWWVVTWSTWMLRSLSSSSTSWYDAHSAGTSGRQHDHVGWKAKLGKADCGLGWGGSGDFSWREPACSRLPHGWCNRALLCPSWRAGPGRAVAPDVPADAGERVRRVPSHSPKRCSSGAPGPEQHLTRG